MRPALLSSLLGSYLVVLGIALLAPLGFYTRNGAGWIPGVSGVDFPSTGVVRSQSPASRLYMDLTSGAGLTAEVWFSSHSVDQRGPARIVSYSLDTSARNFTLAQSGRALIVRLRTSHTGVNGTPDLEVKDVIAPGARQHAVVTYDFRTLCVYLDGRRRICSETPGGDFRSWDPSHDFVLGNEATGDRPWLGTIFLVALYNHPIPAEEIERAHATRQTRKGSWAPAANDGVIALYTFTGRSGTIVADSSQRPPVDLEIPALVEPIRPFLSRESQLLSRPITRYAILEAIVNVLIFVPCTILGCMLLDARGWRPSKAITIAILLTGVFSLSIESFQYFLVSRSSELQDVVLNVISGAAGTGLYRVTSQYRRNSVLPHRI